MSRVKRRMKTLYEASKRPSKREHPEDQRIHVESVARAERDAPQFAAEHAEELMRLIATYPDATASDMLDALREAFWGCEWRPAAPPIGKEYDQ